jgi:alkanesulfonate monooxygenase SsuD/methylene tetrahydromethanopterin reductase-like flavin-dependent oxidoreductase (luciferase family)
MEPKPFQKPGPPVWFGGSHPAALRRAVRYGDGFFGAGSNTTAQFAEQVQIVREELAGQQRDPASFPIAKRVYIAVDDDPERARQRMSAALNRLYSFFRLGDMTPVSVWGTPEDCARGLRDVAAAGAELILLNPLFDDDNQMERLAAEVVPQLS